MSAITVAKKIGMPAEQVFKTLLTPAGPGIYRFAVIPGDAELDFKKLRACRRPAQGRNGSRSKTCSHSPATFAAASPSSAPESPIPSYIDETAILFDKISVSAGTRGTQLILSPEDYLRAAQALEVEVQTADLTKFATRNTPGAADLGPETSENTPNDPEGHS